MKRSNYFLDLFLGSFVLGLLLIGCAKTPEKRSPEPDSARTTEEGPVVGTAGQHGGHQWLGIPYAQPPVGENRWAEPKPPESRSDTVLADEYASPCPQLASRLGGVQTAREGTPVGSEDCLYLDVYAPEYKPEERPHGSDRLPVMVWIHGGGNVIGHTGLYDASRLASEQNVIVVAVQYRLGPLGWFRHPALRGPNASKAEQSGNFALLDLIRSLKWIRDNVTEFGGDPENVTVFGESAGGRNVYNLMLSPLAEGLFDRAIVQSGVLATTQPDRAEQFVTEGGHHNSSREVLIRLLHDDDRVQNREEARSKLKSMDSESVESYLRSRSPEQLMAAVEDSELGMPMDPARVFADGTVLPDEDPRGIFRDPARYNDVPIITGTNRDETKIFLSQDDRWMTRILGFYPSLYEPDLYEIVAEYTSRQWKAHAVDQPADVLSQSQGNVYGYRFDWDEFPSFLGADLSKILGASHGFEIPFVLGDFGFGGEMADYLFTESNRTGREELSKKMRAFWASFARTGRPEISSNNVQSEWSEWKTSKDDSKYIVFDTPEDGGLRMTSETHHIDRLLKRVRSDDRLVNQRQRCVVYRSLAMYVGHFDREDYEAIEVCEEYDWMDYPWRK